jgi:hypothetical protein
VSTADCLPHLTTLGVDRGSDGEIDFPVNPHVEELQLRENESLARFVDPLDPYPDPHRPLDLAPDDQLIYETTDCVDLPSSPGWYRTEIAIVTTDPDDPDQRRTRYDGTTDWVWVCDCEDEAEAREKLGPPPNESDGDDGATPAETEAGTPTPTDRATPTPTAEPEVTATPTAGDGTTPTETVAEEATPTETQPPDGDTPTTEETASGDGPGFAVWSGLLALVGAILIARALDGGDV